MYSAEKITAASVPELVASLQRELDRIASAIQIIASGQLETFEKPGGPDKPREGMVRIADGVNWNPGSGKGPYWFNGTTQLWETMGGTAIGESVNRILGATFDGGGVAPTAGSIIYGVVPYSGTIIAWDIVSDQPGDAVVDVWKKAGAIPTDADRIAGTEKPTLSAAQLAGDSLLSSWTVAVAAGDVFGFELESASTLTRVVVEIYILPA